MEHGERIGEAQHAQRRAGRRAVDDADIEVAERFDLADRAQRDQLLEAREDQHFLGEQLVGTLAQQLSQPVLDRRPRARQLVEHGDLLRDDVRRDLDGPRAHRPPERVADAVGRIGREQEDAVTVLGGADRRRGCERRLADALPCR